MHKYLYNNTITYTHRRYVMLKSIESLYSHFNAKLTQYLHYRRTVRELALLSDRDLADLGINRCDIDFLARNAAKARI